MEPTAFSFSLPGSGDLNQQGHWNQLCHSLPPWSGFQLVLQS